jgi:catechol 2,3-dioxygenase-like lactoylglutathione lyase family enzyme
MQEIISGIQQIGVGIPDVQAAFKWYRTNFGFNIPVVDAPGTAELMLRYTGGKPHERHAIIAVNIQGGGGLEIWQYTSRTPQAAPFEVKIGDLGIIAAKLKTTNAEILYSELKKRKENVYSELLTDTTGRKHFFVKDPWGNFYEVVETTGVFKKSKSLAGGIYGAVIGVSDIEKAKKFYADVLGYDQIISKSEGQFDDLKTLPGGFRSFSRVVLTHSQARKGAFSRLLGKSEIELVQLQNETPRKIYENRFWGDLGFIQVCFDVSNMSSIKKHCEKYGHPFTIDSNPEIYEKGGEIFGMGDAAGHFVYIEDPDGTLIELVETHRIPILKKIGWYLNLKKRNPEKPLPDFMLKTLAWSAVKD